MRVFEVTDNNGEVLALFIADFYARSSKRGGAWMNAYVAQSKLTGEKPVIANHLNITKPGPGSRHYLHLMKLLRCSMNSGTLFMVCFPKFNIHLSRVLECRETL